MCGHHIVIELRPDPQNPDTWRELETVDLDGARRLHEEERRRGLALARRVAGDFLLAYPDEAPDLYIARYSCNGPEETERPFEHPRPLAAMSPRSSRAAENTPLYRHLEALMLKARAAGDEAAEDELADALDLVWKAADPGELAREVLALRTALTHYADTALYRTKTTQSGGQVTVTLPALEDAGEIARKALAGKPVEDWEGR